MENRISQLVNQLRNFRNFGLTLNKQCLNITAFRFSDLEFTVIANAPERASLELVNELPKHESWETVTETFAGVINLRPAFVMKLLKVCYV